MADPTISINLAVTAQGAVPTSPLTINTNLIGLVSAINPDYTVLPAGLIEDLSSTATLAVALIDSAACETINSLTPFGANPYILTELGAQFGIPAGQATLTSVYVVFSSATIGYRVPQGFQVSDGTYTYVVKDGGPILTGGSSEPLFCLAQQSGSWGVPAGTVTTITSSVPTPYVLTCTNPQPGTPGAGAQTNAQYAAQVLAAQTVTGNATQTYAKLLLSNVLGVQPRLISIVQESGGWKVISGGGDPYATVNAIYESGVDISILQGSVTGITNITQANPGVVTTDINHGFTTGETGINIADVVGMTGANGGPYMVTVIDEKTFSFGVDTTSFGAYVSGGVVTPNTRNITASLFDAPDSYTITFVNPPAQTVELQLDWATISPNFVSASAVLQLGAPALVNYINSIVVGQPINLIELNQVFIGAVVELFNNNQALISEIAWTVSINGVSTTTTGSTSLVYGDPESYFTCVLTDVLFNEV